MDGCQFIVTSQANENPTLWVKTSHQKGTIGNTGVFYLRSHRRRRRCALNGLTYLSHIRESFGVSN